MNIITIHIPSYRVIQLANGERMRVPVTEAEQWNEDDTRCTFCGVRPVYVQPSDGDYYVGPRYICAACGNTFTYQSGEVDNERAALIRAQVQPAPSAETPGAAWATEAER